ncbi:MAG: hypothetical protein KF764_09695 [Labilithrix sp.]|nr:hypothetical protein [Labilithrix sp.]MBX3221959.1 hypothetical protein [Labilithrix sp.]
MSEGRSHDRRYLIQNRAGRLIEARVFDLRTREEVDAYSHDLGIQVMRIPRAVRPVLCADHRRVAVYSQAAADRLVELFTHMNTRLERVAVVVARSNATLAMQLQRIVREAAYDARRVVYDAEDAHAHLAPVLAPDELACMRDFLDEVSGPPSSRWMV